MSSKIKVLQVIPKLGYGGAKLAVMILHIIYMRKTANHTL